MENNQQNIDIKHVDFYGDQLIAIQDNETGKTYAAIRWMCQGLGLTDNQIKSERVKIQEDIVLNKGGRNFFLPTNGGNQSVLCLDIKMIPLWLAKITITPTIQKEMPELAYKLEKYQLEAAEVLAKAFLSNIPCVSNEELLHDPNVTMAFARQLVEISKENELLRIEKDLLLDEVKEMKPLAEFAEAVGNSDKLVDVGEYSKLIHEKGMKIGRNILYAWLRWRKYLMCTNAPYQAYVNSGLFKFIEYSDSEDGGDIKCKTLITGKGQRYLFDKIKKDFIVKTDTGGEQIVIPSGLSEIMEKEKPA